MNDPDRARANANRHFKPIEKEAKAAATNSAAAGINAARVKADTDKTTRLRAAGLAKGRSGAGAGEQARRNKVVPGPE